MRDAGFGAGKMVMEYGLPSNERFWRLRLKVFQGDKVAHRRRGADRSRGHDRFNCCLGDILEKSEALKSQCRNLSKLSSRSKAKVNFKFKVGGEVG